MEQPVLISIYEQLIELNKNVLQVFSFLEAERKRQDEAIRMMIDGQAFAQLRE